MTVPNPGCLAVGRLTSTLRAPPQPNQTSPPCPSSPLPPCGRAAHERRLTSNPPLPHSPAHPSMQCGASAWVPHVRLSVSSPSGRTQCTTVGPDDADADARALTTNAFSVHRLCLCCATSSHLWVRITCIPRRAARVKQSDLHSIFRLAREVLRPSKPGRASAIIGK